MAEELLPANALEKNAPRAIPPLAGFWFRLGALLIDIFLLRLALQATYPVLRPFYLTLGSASVAVGLLFAFAYLALAEGLVGKGVTLGKAILGIRTTDLQGEQASLHAVAIRAAMLLVLAMPFLGGEIATRLAAEGDRNGVFLASTVFNSLAMSFIIANVFLVVLHPLKQTAYDLLAQTVVVRDGGAHNLPAFMEQAASQIAPLQRRAIRVASAAFVALAAINGFSEYRKVFSSEGEQYFRFMQSFEKEFRYRNFHPYYQGAVLALIEKRLTRDGLTSESWARRLPAAANPADRPTSRSHVVVVEFRSPLAIGADDLGTSEALAALGSRVVSWTEQQISDDIFPLDRRTRTRSEIIFQPCCVALLFVQDVNLLLYSHENVTYAEILPLALSKDYYEAERLAAQSAATSAAAEDETTTSAADRPTSGAR